MTKVFYSKEPIDVGKCLNDELIKPIKPHKKPFANPFINTSYVDRIVDNFQKEKMKQAIQNNLSKWGRSPNEMNLSIADCVDEHTRKLAEEAYNEVLNEFEIKIF